MTGPLKKKTAKSFLTFDAELDTTVCDLHIIMQI